MGLSSPPLIFFAALLAGAVNSIAGGGAMIAFPALLFAGLSPISANATTNTAMFVGTIGSVRAYADQIRPHHDVVLRLALASLVGSVIGAILLLTTSEVLFFKLVPFLILAAAILFTVGPSLVRFAHGDGNGAVALSKGAIAAQFAIAIYGGYFGAGQGFAILALLILCGFHDMHEMNGVKTAIAATTNGVAVIPFMVAGAIAWHEAIIMSVGAVVGGFIGARLAQRVNPQRVRVFVLVLSYGLAAYFFRKAYAT